MKQALQALDTWVTIGDILDDASLAASAVVLPAGSRRRPISWVHATEQVDPRPHLRKHELVCTLGSSLVRPRAATLFVRALHESGVSGIALGLGEVHLDPPTELREACERFGVPLLLLEHGIPFRAVGDSVLKRLNQIESKARNLESSLLGRLMARAREGASDIEILHDASSALGGDLSRGPAETGGSVVWQGALDGPSEAFMSQLASLLEFCGLEVARESVEQQQRVGQLVDLITDGLAHPAAILPDIESQGLPSDALRVSFWPLGSEKAIADRWSEALVGATAKEVMLVTGPEDERTFGSLGLVCGYSAVVPFGSLRRAFAEARAALRLARSRGGVAGPRQLATLEALMEQQPTEQLAPFVEQLADPLIEADELGRGDLVATLSAFIDADRQLQLTADRLFVHVNTVRHRLAKIHELSGRDPLTLSGIIDLRIAVWALERRRVLGHRLIKPLGR